MQLNTNSNLTKNICKYLLILLIMLNSFTIQAQSIHNENNYKLDIVSFLQLNRYKPLPPEQNYFLEDSHNEELSQTNQLQSAGLRLQLCKEVQCSHVNNAPIILKNDEAHSIYQIDFAIMMQLGSYRSPRDEGDSNQTNAFEFLPGDQFYTGMVYSLNESLYSEVLLGRNFLGPDLNEIDGGHGPLSGLELTFKSQTYGSLYIWMHRPELAGSYINNTGKKEGLSYHNDFTKLSKSSRSIGQKISYLFKYYLLDFGLHHEIQQFAQTSTTKTNNYIIDSIQYNGLGFALHSPAYKEWKMNFYFSMERSDAELFSLIKNEQNIYKHNTYAYALRSGFRVTNNHFHFRTSLFLPESEQVTQGSRPKISQKGGYIGYGNNPVQTQLLSNFLDMKPFYQHCAPTQSCSSIESSHSEPSMRQPSAVLNLEFSYKGEKAKLGLLTSVMVPVAPSEKTGSNPFIHLKKDPQSFYYKEVEFQFTYHLQSQGHFQFKYNRLYRVLPNEHASQTRQKKHSALAAEGIYIEFNTKL